MMPFKIATTTASFRRSSEDRLASHQTPKGLVVVVADGAGGIPGGARAAELALQIVADAIEHDASKLVDPARLHELLVHADAIVQSDRAAGETTCVVVSVSGEGHLVGASVGDSGALVVKTGSIDDLTASQHRKRRLGSGRAVPVVFERSDLDGTLLLASDGLLAYARAEIIARVVAEHEDLDVAAQALVEAVRLPSGDLQDDVAIVLVRRPCIENRPWTIPETRAG